MSKKISARVSDELYEQVDGVLAAKGSNVTQLVNAAYEYVLRTGELPDADGKREAGRGRAPSEQQLQTLRRRLEATTCPVSEEYFFGKSYDDILEEELRETYEALS